MNMGAIRPYVCNAFRHPEAVSGGEHNFATVGEDIFESEELTNKAYETLLKLMPERFEGEKGCVELADFGDLYINGVYMPCTERLVYTQTTDAPIVNGTLYDSQTESFLSVKKVKDFPEGHLAMNKGIKLRCFGATNADGGVLEGGSLYSVLTPKGDIKPAYIEGWTSPHRMAASVTYPALVISALDDSRHVWQASVDEDISAANTPILKLGLDPEQIKSVFYARTLPLTETGRKRPILHLVRAHQRRIKEGIDIDISRHIRGIDCVTIDSLRFEIRPPAIRQDLHKRWQD